MSAHRAPPYSALIAKKTLKFLAFLRADSPLAHFHHVMEKSRMSYTDILDRAPSRMRADQTLLLDLIAVLTANKAGLRRWSVMRAMRQRAEKANREVTPKFEDDVERAFRKFCEGDAVRNGDADPATALFFRPKEKAGEVWAIYPEKAEAWLNGDTDRAEAAA